MSKKKSKDPLEELLKKKEVIEWQISIAKDKDVITAKNVRLKEIKDQIKDLEIHYNTL